MKRMLTAALTPILLLAAACGQGESAATKTQMAAATTLTPAGLEPAPAGDYTLDKAHASLVFKVDHIGFSNWTARFSKFDSALHFDPANPASSAVEASIDASSIDPANPPEGFIAMLTGEKFLDAKAYPQMTFKTTKVEVTGANTAKVTGDFTLRGQTHPLILKVVYNGGYAGHPYEPNARIGFSAHGSIKRSDYGVDYGLPPPGTTMGVGDKVDIVIEAEFTGPPLRKTAE